jgi:hypothetical protein
LNFSFLFFLFKRNEPRDTKHINRFEQYIDSRFHLLVTDHKDDINNGAFMLRNSAWGKAFVDHWLFLCTNRNKYQFTDNGPFAETVLRFGGNDLPTWSNCSYSHDYCYREMTSKNNGKGNGKDYVICLGKTKVKLMGNWNRTEHRDMGELVSEEGPEGKREEERKREREREREDWGGNNARARLLFFFFLRLFASTLSPPLRPRGKPFLSAKQGASDSCLRPRASTPTAGKPGKRGAESGRARLSSWTACSCCTTRTSKRAFRRRV